jgi:hypothetical protein
MGTRLVGKKNTKVKRFPYIEVTGVQNQYLDAALLHCVDKEPLTLALRDEFKILKKAGILPTELKQEKFSKEDLVRLVSSHLLENYSFYNFLVKKWNEIQIKTLNAHIKGDYTSYSIEQWDEVIRELIKEKDMPVSIAVNLLRFYNNGENKELIRLVLEDFAVRFYYETGVQVEGYNINWNAIDKKIDENKVTSEELDLTEAEIERKPEENLHKASRLIELVADQITELGQTGEFKSRYEQEQEKNEKLNEKLLTLGKELKSKESQHQALLKENKTLSKNVGVLTKKLDLTNKEHGKLSLTLGEIRKEKDEFEKLNNVLERKVNSLEKEQHSIKEKIKQELKREYELKILHIKDEYEKELNILEGELKSKEKKEPQLNNITGSDEFDRLKKELETVKNDLRIVEQERNELAEKIKLYNTTEDETKDNIFGFNEDDIEDFIEFDNKPTRN